jgi:hypothetical protein
MYFFGAFVIPVFILVIAVVLETMVEQESVSKTVVRAGWDGAVTGAGLCGAIGSEFVGLTHGTKNEVAALINANVAPVEIGVIIVAFLCLILLVKIRSAKTIGPLKATFALIIGGVALGVPGYQAWLIALSLVRGTP